MEAQGIGILASDGPGPGSRTMTILACLTALTLHLTTMEFRTLDLYPLRLADREDLVSRRRVWDDLHAAATLQGIVNRSSPRLYLMLVGERGATDRYWLDRLREPGEWLAGSRAIPLADLDEALRVFRSQIKGAVVWDERVPSTSNVASTLAGLYDAVALRYDRSPGSLYHRWVEDPGGPRLPVLARLLNADGSPKFTGIGTVAGTKVPSSQSAKCDAYLWAIETLVKRGMCNPTRLGYYPDAAWIATPRGIGIERTLLSNHDWFVAQRGLMFDLGPWDDEPVDDDPTQPLGADARTFRALLAACRAKADVPIHIGGFTPWDQKYTDFTGGDRGGVATEWLTVEIATCFDAYLDADAPGLHAMANASFYQHFPLKKRYEQKNVPTRDSLRQDGLLDARTPCVAFYVGDYDSAAWLYEMMPSLWDDPVRGQIPLGWAFNPALELRFPVGLTYARRTASALDTFVAGDSGAGYVNPGLLDGERPWSGLASGLDRWVRYSKPLLERWDLRLTGFVIDGNAPAMNDRVKRAYAKLSPGGVFAQKVPEAELVDGVPFARMGSDLPSDIEEAAQLIVREAPKGVAWYRQYRTVLWSPTKHKQLMDRVRALRPDIRFVDPHALMILIREQAQRP